MQNVVLYGGLKSISDLDLSWHEEQYLTKSARKKVMGVMRSGRSRRNFGDTYVPESITYFVRFFKEWRPTFARFIQRIEGHFVHWRPLKTQLPSLRWILDVSRDRAIEIMAEIELLFIQLVIDDMHDSGYLVRDETLKIWYLNPAKIKRPNPGKKRALRKSRTQKCRPRHVQRAIARRQRGGR